MYVNKQRQIFYFSLFYKIKLNLLIKKLNNKYIAIITAENKEKYIVKTILSCLNQSNNNNLRIFVVYSNLANENNLKKKFKKNKKISFFKYDLKKLPMHDQLHKIQQVVNLLKNEWVLLLDGDDLFKKNKIQTIENLKLNKDRVYLNNHILFDKKKNIKQKMKIYKEWNLYKILFNDWPQNINTSSIIINANYLKKFYKQNNPYKWKYLAIDSQLILFAHYKKKLIHIKEILTLKRSNINNIDKTFSNYLTKVFWLRRYEQHNLTKQISNKKNYVDRFITYIFKRILK